MLHNNKNLWILSFLTKLSSSFFFMSIISFVGFFIVSRQGISAGLAQNFIKIVSIFSYVTIIVIIISLILVFIKKNSVFNKIKEFLSLLIRLLLSVGILVFVNTIYILSLGIME